MKAYLLSIVGYTIMFFAWRLGPLPWVPFLIGLAGLSIRDWSNIYFKDQQ